MKSTAVLDRHLSRRAQERAEVAPVEVFHHEERRAGLELADVVDARDVLAAKARGGLPLAEEARHHVGACQRFGQQELDGDSIAQREVTRSHDDAHPARPKDALHLVFAREDVADVDR
jgi:hypothetical protein